MPKCNETNGKKIPILKKTMESRKRKKPCVDPIPMKKIKPEEAAVESDPNAAVPFFVSELNVLPDAGSVEMSDSWLEERATWWDLETQERTALEEMEKVIQDTQPQDLTSPERVPHDWIEEDTPLEGGEEQVTPLEGQVTCPKNEEFVNVIKTKVETEEKDYEEYYVNGYCLRNNMKDQYYARNHTGDEIYWKDSVNSEIYAYKSVNVNDSIHKIEYPAIQKNEPKYIYDRAGKPRYPVNLATHTVIFPKNPETNEEIYLPDRKGVLFYPENKFGQQFYRKDADGNEVLINNTYAKYADGSQIYPKKANEDQFYLKLSNLEVPAVKRIDKNYVPYYAQKKNGDQIYPREYIESEDNESPKD